MKKFLLIMAMGLLLVSCVEKDNREDIVKVYSDEWGRPTTIVEENIGNVLFVTYTWDSAKGHAKLVLSKSKSGWEEVRFTSY